MRSRNTGEKGVMFACSAILQRVGPVSSSHTALSQALYLIHNKCKNEVSCRDDTVPKTAKTRGNCEED